MKYRVLAERTKYYIAEVEADSEADAREVAQAADTDWQVDYSDNSVDYVITDVSPIVDDDGAPLGTRYTLPPDADDDQAVQS